MDNSADFLAEVETIFGTRDLYAVLGVEKSAEPTQISRSFRKLALTCHPDRLSADLRESGRVKFQALNRIHELLSNEDTRALYDTTGGFGSQPTVDSRVLKEDIDAFYKAYRFSEEETNDLIEAYLEFEGDMQSVIDNVMCSADSDEDRFRAIVRSAIDSNGIPEYPIFFKSLSKRAQQTKKRKQAQEANEAKALEKEILGKKKQKGTGNDLLGLVAMRSKTRNADLLQRLSAKHGNGEILDDPLGDMEFERIQREMLARKK